MENIFMALLAIAFFAMFAAFLYEKKQRIKLNAELLEIGSHREDNFLRRAKYSEIGLMTAGLTHEINNSLAIIMGSATQLQKNYRKPDAEKNLATGLNQIVVTSEKMARTVKGIRELIYQNEGSEGDVLLTDLIDSTLTFWNQRLKNHGIDLRLNNLEGIHIRGNKVQLEQAILNLISNSFDAIDESNEKWIEIRAIEKDDSVDIYFRDSGKGIPDDIRAKMLEPYFTTKKGKGTGLGLPLVKGIAEKHGGDFVYVDKAEHTTFLLELPKFEAPKIVLSNELA